MVWIDYASSFDKICEGGKHKTHLCIPLRQGIARDWRGVPKFIDEPTIGLDVVAKEKIRGFVGYMNKTENTTMIFTTHDMQDIEKVCSRLIIIDNGKMIYDGSVDEIKKKYSNEKTVEIELSDGRREKYTFDSDKTGVNEVLEKIFRDVQIKDISINEPEIDGIIRDIYERGVDIL